MVSFGTITIWENRSAVTTEYCFNDEDTEALTGAWNDLMMMTVIVTVKIYHLFIMCHTQLSSYMLSYFFLTRTPRVGQKW